MPVIPTFNSYAPMPNLAQSSIAARGQVIGQRQNAAQLRQRSDIASAELQQRQQQMAIESAAAQEEMQRRRMRDMQEMEIQKSYNQARLQLQEQQLKQKEEDLRLKTQQAAQSFAARQRFQGLIASGTPHEKAIWMEPGVVPSGAYSAAMKPPQQAFVPRTTSINGKNYIQTSPNQWRMADLPERMGSVDQAKLDRVKSALMAVDKALMEVKKTPIQDEDTQRIARDLEETRKSLEEEFNSFGSGSPKAQPEKKRFVWDAKANKMIRK